MTSTDDIHAVSRDTVDLAGKVAWVTGAAGGIGAATASLLRRWNATVVGTDLRATEQDPNLWACSALDPEEITQTVARLEAEHGRLDILVNNAGVLRRTSVLDITEEDWDTVHQVNVRGTFFTAQAAARLMRSSGGGSIINLSSFNAEAVSPETVPYATSKGAIKTMTKGLAVALGQYGIRVNSVAPGAVRTDINADRFSDPEMTEYVLSRTVLGRLGTPEDIAPTIGFLASDASRYTTGSFYEVHGGWSVRG